MLPRNEEIVSIIGSSYFRPITDLIEKLIQQPKVNASAVTTGHYENGYSAALVLLLVAMLESYMVRVRLINKGNVPENRISISELMKTLYQDYQQYHELTEVFVLRDLIFHNHLWTMEYSWNEQGSPSVTGAEKDDQSGDKKYLSVVDIQNHRTKKLHLHVIPIQVNRDDVVRVFKVIWSTLLFLENKDRQQCYVSHMGVIFRGEARNFGELIDILSA